ncbi:MAG: ribonuclease III [Candidatus Peregrinibacteria bacterium]|nr:ribonuclease III [Candidatus Peregrinibacteria bacterium]
MHDYTALLKKIGVQIHNEDLLKLAFIHKSYVNEQKGLKEHNERLEFLGDAVLELVTTEYLFKNYPLKQEGELTNWRSALVKGNHLAEVSRELSLGKYLNLSRGEEHSGGREKPHILANVLEAVIGAIFLDRGYRVSRKFIDDFILTKLDVIIEKGLHIDGKSLFQEMAQGKLNTTPHYVLLSETGPDHNKVFTMGAYIGEELIAKGNGASKQKAEENAAMEAVRAQGWDQA